MTVLVVLVLVLVLVVVVVLAVGVANRKQNKVQNFEEKIMTD